MGGAGRGEASEGGTMATGKGRLHAAAAAASAFAVESSLHLERSCIDWIRLFPRCVFSRCVCVVPCVAGWFCLANSVVPRYVLCVCVGD